MHTDRAVQCPHLQIWMHAQRIYKISTSCQSACSTRCHNLLHPLVASIILPRLKTNHFQKSIYMWDILCTVKDSNTQLKCWLSPQQNNKITYITTLYTLLQSHAANSVTLKKGKGKAVPLQAWSGPEGSRKLRFPYFMITEQDGGKVVNLTHWPPSLPGNTPGIHFC